MDEESPGHHANLAAGFAAGSWLGGYRLEQQVGAGGMAVVFRARDERLDRLVALKIMTPTMGSDDMFRQRFIRESRAAAAVDDPHIIPVYEAGEVGQVLFIAMRFVRGGDVRSLLRREGPLSPERVASIISPVASALDAAHAAGLVHRDVKPANILLDRRPGRPDHVYLSDFGLSKSAEVSLGLTAAGQFLGTPDYTAPEQIEGLPVDGRTDQYALACAVFELLTGQAPFHRTESFASIWAHLNKPPPSLTERRPELPPAVDPVIAKALAKAQVDRYETCWEFADALREAFGMAAYHLGPASDPGLSGPGSSLSQDGPRGNGWSPVPAGSPAAGSAEPPPGEDTEASQVYVAPAPAANQSHDHLAPQREVSIPDDQATDPGLQAIPRDPATGRVQAPEATSLPPGPPDSEPSAPAQELTDAPVPELAGAPAQELTDAPAPEVADAPAPEVSATPAPEVSATPAPEAPDAADAPAQEPAPPGGPRVSPRRPAAPGSWPSLPRSRPAGSRNRPSATRTRPATPRNRPATPRKQPDAPTKPGEAPGKPAGGVHHVRERRRRHSAYLTLIGAGVLVAAVLTTLLTTNFLASSGGQHVATPSAYSHRIFPPVAGILSSVAFSPDGATLSAGATGDTGTGLKGSANGTTYLWSVKTMKVRRLSPGGGAEAFSPDGTMLATAGGPHNKSTYLRDVSTGDTIATLPDEQHASVDSVAFSSDGRKLAANDVNGTAYVWTLPGGGRAPTNRPAVVTPPAAGVASTALAFSPKGETLAVGASDGQVYLWNAQTENNSGTLNDHGSGGVTSVAFSPNGQLLAAGETSGVTYVWNLASRRLITLPDPDSFRVDSVAFSPDSHWLATGDDNGKTYLWNMRGRNPATKPAVTLPNPKSSATGNLTGDQPTAVFSVAFSPVGTTLATTDTNGRAYLWKVRG